MHALRTLLTARRPLGRRGLPLAPRLVAVLALVLGAACSKGFQPRRFPTTNDLYRASVGQFDRHKWDNALAGFDLLATQLPARDTLLARVYYYQGQAHARKSEHLLAAQAYQRITDAFPDASVADTALFEQGREYQRLWSKPALDPGHGQTALATFRQLLTLYPESPLVPATGREIAKLNDWFARKDFETGMHYLRRKAYDSAIIYLKDVTRLYPGTPTAKQAYLRLVDAYGAIRYKEDVAETCTEARKFYPEDGDVRQACGGVAPVATPADTARPRGGAGGR